jgi:hypothetical protein
MNRKKVKILMLCFGFMLIATVTYSQDPPVIPPPPPPPGLPIDGGLSLLFASGVAYGIYSLKRKK